MQGSYRDKKSFPLTLGDEEGHKGAEADPRLLEFLPWTLAMSHCSEEDWNEKMKKKRYVPQHNK
jgi:hypothetical protein